MITQIILKLHEQALENPSGLPESIVMEAVKALGGFYARTGSRRIASLLASAVRNKSLSNENRIFSYIEMLSVLKEPLENFPTNLATFQLDRDARWDIVYQFEYSRFCGFGVG